MTELETAINKIVGQTGINRDELMKRIRDKQAELFGFLTLEGAARVVGREMGVWME